MFELVSRIERKPGILNQSLRTNAIHQFVNASLSIASYEVSAGSDRVPGIPVVSNPPVDPQKSLNTSFYNELCVI